MYITVKGMLTQSIQRIKAMLLCIEYGILFVDTKIKAHNALNAMFVETLALTQHLIQSTMRCENTSINSLDIAQHSMHCML